ncbi:MAG: hypothetical protein DRI79_08920 [Chloroflexi bacterium]|nr:MAG: hypothetical protein DRI80_09490 [Chloroflexota bacterium]RLC87228.1 MAG: hypothetical protein DRI79_08920 [Chloroflexota bacterium]HEY66663.1 FtsQ-type POTRA domain-containing protein [Thermoflexia bacterium]
MVKSRKRGQRRKGRRFETASTLVLGRARVRRPSKIRHSLLLLLIAVAAGALWLALDDRFYIYHADVLGVTSVSPNEVFRASGLPGLHILWVHPDEVEARILAALPTVKSARVVCGLPAKCTITVVEREPMVMWDEGGQLWWIDADGVVFPAQGTLSDGWLVRGPLPRDEDGRLDERVRVALTELWTAGANVSPLLYVPGRGLVFTDERGWRVIVGQGPGMAERLRVLEHLAANLQARGLTPRFVDVRFPDAPYYSEKNEW